MDFPLKYLSFSFMQQPPEKKTEIWKQNPHLAEKEKIFLWSVKLHLRFSFSVFRQDSHQSLRELFLEPVLAFGCHSNKPNPLCLSPRWAGQEHKCKRQCSPSSQTPKGYTKIYDGVLQTTSIVFTAALKLSYIHCWRQKKTVT